MCVSDPAPRDPSRAGRMTVTEPQDSVVSPSATDVSTVRDGRAPQPSYQGRIGGAAAVGQTGWLSHGLVAGV